MMKENIEGEEKAKEPSEEEKVEEPSEPVGAQEAADKFYEEKAKEEKEEKPSEKETETEPEEKVSEEEVSEEKPPEARLWIIDEKGNKTPLIAKADGKYHAPDKAEKALQWAGLGVHANTIVEGVKKDKEAFDKSRPILEMLLEGYEKGILSVGGKPILPPDKGKEEEEPGEEEDVTVDPELKELKKKVKVLEDDKLKGFIEKNKAKIDSEITEHKKISFAAIVRSEEDSPKEVWDLLAEEKEDGTGAKYTVEEAMKKSHDLNIAFAKKLVKENPKEFEVDEDEIYARKLKEKQEQEKAPVSGPSEAPAVVETKLEEMDFEGPAEAYEAFKKQQKQKTEAAKKS
jgi:hypothetical protein